MDKILLEAITYSLVVYIGGFWGTGNPSQFKYGHFQLRFKIPSHYFGTIQHYKANEGEKKIERQHLHDLCV